MKKFLLITLVLVMVLSFSMMVLQAPFFGWFEPNVGWNAQLTAPALAFSPWTGGPVPLVGWNS